MATEFDVLVVGGGVIGASAGHHIASAGYKTLLVEQGDYASGTSSRTSRMQNSGFMYFVEANNSPLRAVMRPLALLKALELARRTMRDRADLVRTSPDRVRKVEFLVPFEAHGKITRRRMKIAVKMLELMGGSAVSLEPKFLDAAQARSHPFLKMTAKSETLRGALSFAEYQYTWPERIVVDTILKGRAAGLDARNYTRLVGLSRDRDGWKAVLEHDGAPYTVWANAVVNASGAWVDHITRLASNDATPLNSGAKGVNLAVRLPEAAKGFGLEAITPRGTAFYIFPWGDLHYMGPADSPADAMKTEFRATDGEIAEILADANRLFPDLRLHASDVVYCWAGVRPRTAFKGAPLGSLEVREHDLSSRGLPNFFVFTGGLIMTHRDAGRRLLKAVQRSVKPSGAPRRIDYALKREPDEGRVSAASVRRAIKDEQARTLGDILRRRLSVGWEPDLALSKVEDAARFAAEVLSWSEAERQRQIEAYRAEVEKEFRPQSLARTPVLQP